MTTKTCTYMALSQFELSKIVLKNLNQFNLSSTTKLVLLALVDCYNPKNNLIFPKQITIAEQLGISISSVKRAIKELSTHQIVIYELKNINRYKLTSTFFELLKLTPDKVQNESSSSIKLTPPCHEQIKQEQNKKQNIFLNFNKQNQEIIILSNGFKVKTSFQKEYIDVFEKLTSEQIEKYKLLDGYEREKWLIIKRQEYRKSHQIKTEIKKIKEIPEVELPEFKDRKKGMEFCFNHYKMNSKSLVTEGSLAYKIAQYWDFNEKSYKNYKFYNEV